mmetsp:Transcript_2193/g.6334  ORF Transcript_2193/g.6334 Transcript_2193/m.6334 type:complete len:251 (+) Transcript_2193:209-961(+)
MVILRGPRDDAPPRRVHEERLFEDHAGALGSNGRSHVQPLLMRTNGRQAPLRVRVEGDAIHPGHHAQDLIFALQTRESLGAADRGGAVALECAHDGERAEPCGGELVLPSSQRVCNHSGSAGHRRSARLRPVWDVHGWQRRVTGKTHTRRERRAVSCRAHGVSKAFQPRVLPLVPGLQLRLNNNFIPESGRTHEAQLVDSNEACRSGNVAILDGSVDVFDVVVVVGDPIRVRVFDEHGLRDGGNLRGGRG